MDFRIGLLAICEGGRALASGSLVPFARIVANVAQEPDLSQIQTGGAGKRRERSLEARPTFEILSAAGGGGGADLPFPLAQFVCLHAHKCSSGRASSFQAGRLAG